MTTTSAHPDELVQLSACRQRALIASGELSPLELMDAHIARMQALEPAVNALCETDFERARAQARVAGDEAVAARRGGAPLPLLHGLALGVKDMEDTAGLRTTYGNIAHRNHVPRHDCGMVARLKAAGAIVAAKTNTPDMAAGANTRNAVWGATGNPFNPALNAGGSSGGSAVALALDMLPLATGSDLAGSLRTPAALCGVVGFRPGAGLVAMESRPLGWNALSVLGPMARNVDDAALLLAAMLGQDPRDPLSYPASAQAFTTLPEVDAGRLRVGFTSDFGNCIVDDEIRRVFTRFVQALAPQVGAVVPLALQPGETDHAFDVLRAENFLASHAATYRRAPETLGPNVRANLELAMQFTLQDRAEAHAEQTRFSRHLQRQFEAVDLIVAPISPCTPFPWTELYATQVGGVPMRNYYHWLGLTYMVTLAGNPALALPAGLDEHGMPFGVQLIGRLRGETALLAAGRAIEAVLQQLPGLQRPRPDLAALAQPRPELKSIVTHAPTPTH